MGSSARRCESHESCFCIVGFSACGCQKKSIVYEMECRHAAVQRGKQDQNTETHTIVSDGADFLGEVIRKDIRKVVKC